MADEDATPRADRSARPRDADPPARNAPDDAHSVSGYDMQPDDPEAAQHFADQAERVEQNTSTAGDSFGMRGEGRADSRDRPVSRTPPAPG